MRLWGGSSPKRAILVSNGKSVQFLGTGTLVKAKHPSSVQTTLRYVDSSGRVRFKGSGALKGTQRPSFA